jgi:hypothetical protein
MKKSRRRWLTFLLVVVAAVAVAAYVRWLHLADSAHRVTLDAAERVCAGMTQREVEDIFGVPPGDYSSQPGTVHPEGLPKRPPDLRREDWTADEGGTVVYFDEDGRVVDRIVWVAPGQRTASIDPFRKVWHGLRGW